MGIVELLISESEQKINDLNSEKINETEKLFCLIRKDKNHPLFKKIRVQLYNRLSDRIPRMYGLGLHKNSYKMQKIKDRRREAMNVRNNTMDEFDQVFNYQEEDPYFLLNNC
jgi:hypothetical protein